MRLTSFQSSVAAIHVVFVPTLNIPLLPRDVIVQTYVLYRIAKILVVKILANVPDFVFGDFNFGAQRLAHVLL